jgi:hypothetical protein
VPVVAMPVENTGWVVTAVRQIATTSKDRDCPCLQSYHMSVAFFSAVSTQKQFATIISAHSCCLLVVGPGGSAASQHC